MKKWYWKVLVAIVVLAAIAIAGYLFLVFRTGL